MVPSAFAYTASATSVSVVPFQSKLFFSGYFRTKHRFVSQHFYRSNYLLSSWSKLIKISQIFFSHYIFAIPRLFPCEMFGGVRPKPNTRILSCFFGAVCECLIVMIRSCFYSYNDQRLQFGAWWKRCNQSTRAPSKLGIFSRSHCRENEWNKDSMRPSECLHMGACCRWVWRLETRSPAASNVQQAADQTLLHYSPAAKLPTNKGNGTLPHPSPWKRKKTPLF